MRMVFGLVLLVGVALAGGAVYMARKLYWCISERAGA
jgi:hypothetical protein